MPRFRALLLTAVILLLAPSALAQGEWFRTGVLTTVIDGVERELHTYGTYVAEDVADGVEDERQRALLERIAGTEQHTATHMYSEERKLGPVILAPATVWVALTFHHDGHDSTAPHGVTLQIPLDPASLALSDPEQVEITYFPEGPSYEGFYALTDGELTLTTVEVVDEVTLRVAGSFSGRMSRQSGYDIEHDEGSAIDAYGEFVVERVVGSQLVLTAIEGE